MQTEPAESATAGGRVAICIPTFQRHQMLRECLASIGRLNIPGRPDCELIVADNDAQGGARTVCDEWRPRLSCPLHYVIEPQRGLVFIRNRLLEEALKLGAGWLAFIDDDEVADPYWLERHLQALHRFDAAVSSGPALPGVPGDPLEGRGPSRGPTGSTPRHVACNNVMFSMRLVREQQLRFDPRFNLIGGEDFDFFDRSLQLGNRHVWVEDARVFEAIPPERATWRYLFRRHFSGAINSVVRYRKDHGAARAWLHFTVKAIGKILGAGLALLRACLHNRRRHAEDAVKRLANALGYFSGLCNFIVERYR